MNIFICLALICSAYAVPTYKDVDDDFANEALIRSLYDRQKSVKNVDVPSIHMEGSRFSENSNLTMVGFSWSNCGSTSDPVQINELDLSPEPITIPGTEVVDVDAKVAKTVKTLTQLKLVIKKKLFGVYIEVPCVDNVGSCTYNDPCSLLAKVTCPPEFVKAGFTCRCPFEQKSYKLSKVSVKIPDLKLPSFIEDGDYEVDATLMNGSTRVACYSVKASLKQG